MLILKHVSNIHIKFAIISRIIKNKFIIKSINIKKNNQKRIFLFNIINFISLSTKAIYITLFY